jgi:hypothetical protein
VNRVDRLDRSGKIALWLLVIGVWGLLIVTLWRPGSRTASAPQRREYGLIICRGTPALQQRLQEFDRNDAPKGWRIVSVVPLPALVPLLGPDGPVNATPRADFALIVERAE